MRNSIVFLVLLALSAAACNSESQNNSQSGASTQQAAGLMTPTSAYSIYIARDSANKMIGSYLNSINYSANDTDLRALVIDVDQLRRYTDSMGTSMQISHLKLFFAHTLEYINSGHANEPAGYKSGALTLVIAGYDDSGNYIYFTDNRVLEYCMPCPSSCPPGNAGNAFLIL